MKTSFSLLATLVLLSATINGQTGDYALEFNGTSSYINCGTGSSFNIDGTAITIEAWVYTKDINQNWQTIAGKQTGHPGVYALVIDSDTKKPALYLQLNTYWNWARRVISNTVLEQEKWYHIAATYDGSNARIYINGTLDNTTACTGTILTDTNLPFWIGRNGGVYFNGKIDEVRLWNVARTDAEIKANMYKEIGIHANLKAYYKMSDGSGTSITDNSGNNNTGTFESSPQWKLSGAFAGPQQALDFDGINDYVDCGINSNAKLSNNFTISTWLKTTPSYSGTSWKTFLTNHWLGFSSGMILSMNGGTGLFHYAFCQSNGVWTSRDPANTVINDSKWHHVAITFASGIIKTYFDGKLIESWNSGLTSVVYTNSKTFQIGRDSGTDSEYFPGQIDEVCMWNRVLSDNEICENMMRNKAGNETNLVVYYRMDQKDGTTLYDQTANAINGTLTNMDAATDWVTSTAYNMWLGGESSELGTAANWSNGVPSVSDNVGIYKWNLGNELSVSSEVNTGSVLVSATANPTLDAAINTAGAFIPLRNVNLKFTTNNAIGTINNPTGNELIVPADAKVTVSTAIDNAGKIILKSDDTNSAQIKNTGTAPTPGTVVLRKDLKATSGWYFISFPFDVALSNIKKTSSQSTATIGDYRTATGPIYDDLYIIEYNGARRDATGTATATNSPNWDAVTTGTLSAKKGYAIRVMSDIEIDFIGTTNADMFANSDKSATIGDQHTNGNVIHHGWNLVGIPFTTAFNINNLSQGTYFYVYNQSNQNYVVKEKNVDTYQLDAFGAFFMQASSTNLTFANAGRALKAPAVVNLPVYTKIDLAITNGTFTDNTQIRLMQGAEYTYELNKDAAKMLSMNSAVPQLWTKAEAFDVAINALPETTSEVTLGIRVGAAGNYTFKLNTVTQNQTAILVDNSNGNRINLNEQKSYTFSTTQTGTITNRFKIVTKPDVSTTISEKNNAAIKITSLENGFTMTGLTGNVTVKMIDMTGKTIATYNNVQSNSFYKSDYKGAVIYNVTDNLNNCEIKSFAK